MSTLNNTILEDVKKLATLEGIICFKSKAYAQKDPALSASLEKIADCLKQAHKYIVKDIDRAMQDTDKSFSNAVKAPSIQPSLYLEPMDEAESLAAQKYPQGDSHLQSLSADIKLLQQRVREYSRLKAAKIEKLITIKKAATMFLLAQLEEL